VVYNNVTGFCEKGPYCTEKKFCYVHTPI